MRRNHRAGLIATALVIHLTQRTAPASADEVVLDLGAVLARAAVHAPAAATARARIGEAAATRVSAAVRFTDNPELEVEAGPRLGTEVTPDLAVRLGQTFALGGRRRARQAVAAATVAHAHAAADATARELQLAAATAFYDALHAERVVAIATGAAELAGRAAEVADRRRRGGDLTDLDADLTRAAAGRARAAVHAAEAERAAAIGRLAGLVGLATADTVTLRGELRTASAATLTTLAPAVAARADLRALAAERLIATSELGLARASGRPELGVWASYAREDDATVLLGGVRLTLPIWQRGQGARAEARAKAAGLAAVYEATRRGAAREVADAVATYQRARAAVEVFEAEVLPVLDASEALLGKGVDAGTLAVSDYLVARQELLAGRREYLDRLLALATAQVEAQLAAGVSP